MTGKTSFNKLDLLVGYLEKVLGNDAASLVYSFISTTIYFFMMAWSKVYVNEITPLQTQFIRGLVLAATLYVFGVFKDLPIIVSNRRKNYLVILRNLISGFFNILSFYMIPKIPISVMILIQTSSLFIVAFIDRLCYKTTYSKTEIIGSVLSILGVSFIVKPDLFFDVEVIIPQGKGYAEGFERIVYITIFIIGVIGWSGSVVLLKSLKEINQVALSFPFGVCTCLSSAVFEIVFEQVKVIPAWIYPSAILALGIGAFFNQQCYVRAIQLGKPAKVTMIGNLNVVYGFLFEIFYLNEQKEWFSYLGAFLIVGSSLWVSFKRLK